MSVHNRGKLLRAMALMACRSCGEDIAVGTLYWADDQDEGAEVVHSSRRAHHRACALRYYVVDATLLQAAEDMRIKRGAMHDDERHLPAIQEQSNDR